MTFYRRRLPHVYEIGQPVFLTWITTAVCRLMPNHVHLLATPAVALPKLTKSLKGITAKRANELLGLTGTPFWQEESYDHLVQREREFEKIRNYIEANPV